MKFSRYNLTAFQKNIYTASLGLAKPAFFGYTEHGSTRSAVKKGGTKMNMQENARLILGLRAKGWTDTEIADFLLWIESGDEQYKPKGNDA